MYIYERITEKMAGSIVVAAAVVIVVIEETYFLLYGLPRMFQGLPGRDRWDPRGHTLSICCSSELLVLSPTTYLASLVQCFRGH